MISPSALGRRSGVELPEQKKKGTSPGKRESEEVQLFK